MMRKIFNLTLFIFFVSACAHHRSGRYVLKNGKWVFEQSKVGFMYNGLNYDRVDDSEYDFKEDGRFIWPVPSSKKVSSYFGKRNGRHHDGIDIPAITGTHVVAADDGVVIMSGWMRGYGRIVVVKHDDGYHTVYAHNSKHYVKKGQKVSKGEVIANVGSSGRSTGPHLHFEIRKKNKVRNPRHYLARLKGP